MTSDEATAGCLENQFNKLGVRALGVLGRQEWLDRPSYRIEHVLSFLFYAAGGARERITNMLHGVWLGHPVHPPLASLTSGAIGTTVALDVISVLPGLPRTEVVDASRFARRALGVGIVANLMAAVTGATDWQHTHERERRIGLVHGVLNLIATALYIRSWCPHLAAPMADGWIDKGSIVCPWHGSRFAVDSGEVVRGPATAPLPSYLTRIADGMIEVRNGSQSSLVAGKGVAK